jgi:thiol-disulfide isomerase/thioredoxin
MKKTILADIITYFFVLLFTYTGAAKLADIHTVREQLLSTPLLGSPLFASIVTWALPIGEILLALALIIPKLQLKTLYATLSLMTVFTIYVTVLLFVDSHITCSCGGIIEQLSPKQHVLFNGACVILSRIAIAIYRRQPSNRQFRWVAGTSSLLLFALVGWTLFSAFTAPTKITTGMEGRLLPAFDLLLPDSTTHFNTADIPAGRPFIVIGFSPFCTHCQAETREIIKNMQLVKNIPIYYVTGDPFGQMSLFYKAFKLSRYPNIAMGWDQKSSFLRYFKARGIPYTAIFDSKKRLKQVFQGEAKADTLARLAAEN